MFFQQSGCMELLLKSLFVGLLVFAMPTMAAAKNAHVVLETSLGNLTVKLLEDKAPISCNNFLQYVDAGFYKGTVFHRVISDFMIQGGGFTEDLKQKATKAAIKNEADNGLKNKRGTLAMARTSVVDSATSQFFINTVDNSFLDHRGKDARSYGYAVFAEIVDGMDVVDKIRNVKTLCSSRSGGACDAPLPPGMRDVPAEAVVILNAYRKK